MVVLLPRSFHGSLLLTARQTVKLSDDLLRRSTTLSTVEHTRRYFVGDFSHQIFGDDWNGDELKVVSRDGRITIRYVDEEGGTGGRGLAEGFSAKDDGHRRGPR